MLVKRLGKIGVIVVKHLGNIATTLGEIIIG